ncbi:MAG: exopolysaccharide biosynthesis polyprenyl glycosylphosphotransferase [Bacteroidia bacterium]|nr:exopolysaccharide biosynthesis polyprenyl glycosylphosphotransferase [Bacteroidia bacterium]NNF31523.1 exopolysaccharide biosynthesis polyprenyl glycosylphosphotransferase [Flavobacteriaceae bacterium]MBT8275598.1 exopolysaccharide biosynthesis polyprenyl glycosylphosphotransferase [Bacteroidia bacterium]NNJ82788.1 exopolysaccharide biosynthesis polyprenyl glycosylphosphotransferase [Flavobacteriaceae bacterium]NNK54102.1 exopolysaccharide biosynthesis polyprenyl glycosylphosphotransferase [
MIYRTGRYSGYLRPISYLIDLAIIHVLAYQFFSSSFHFINYVVFITVAWIVISLRSRFYEIFRFTRLTTILSLVGKQGVLFLLLVFAFFGFYRELQVEPLSIFRYVLLVILYITIVKVGIYYLLKKYRVILRGNLRRVVIVGLNQKTDQLRKFFDDNPEYGYKLLNIFDLSGPEKVSIEDCLEYINENKIDEIYSSVGELSNEELTKLIDYSDNNLKILKFLPDNKEIYSKRLDFTYYGYLPILSMRKIPIEEPFNKFIKRGFDILLSLIIIVGILSWLTPLLGLIIKLESKGPIFFKQKRNGLDYQEFYCYKFRSMRPNPMAHLHQVQKNDPRVTKIGRIIRKTSIDELPQFINVLKGEMSVVGPRPHMVSHTHMYAERIDKFMVRHFVKPGITGLAQVSGYRGEVEDENHIINRVKYDIFYLENWSLFLDLKIVFQTVYNAIKGDKRAY